MTDNWYCCFCDEWLSPDEVTFDERHDENQGGCGNKVDPIVDDWVWYPDDVDPYGPDTLEEKHL